MLFEAGIKLLTLILLLGSLQSLLGVFVLVGGGVHIHDRHVLNTVCPLPPEVSDK